jgi:hypothetical protein
MLLDEDVEGGSDRPWGSKWQAMEKPALGSRTQSQGVSTLGADSESRVAYYSCLKKLKIVNLTPRDICKTLWDWLIDWLIYTRFKPPAVGQLVRPTSAQLRQCAYRIRRCTLLNRYWVTSNLYYGSYLRQHAQASRNPVTAQHKIMLINLSSCCPIPTANATMN